VYLRDIQLSHVLRWLRNEFSIMKLTSEYSLWHGGNALERPDFDWRIKAAS
jgi:hypothetical protein